MHGLEEKGLGLEKILLVNEAVRGRGRTSLWELRLAHEDSAVGHHPLPLGCPGRAADLFLLHCYYSPVRGKLLNGSAQTCTSYKGILEHGRSHGMRLNFVLHYFFFFLLT